MKEIEAHVTTYLGVIFIVESYLLHTRFFFASLGVCSWLIFRCSPLWFGFAMVQTKRGRQNYYLPRLLVFFQLSLLIDQNLPQIDVRQNAAMLVNHLNRVDGVSIRKGQRNVQRSTVSPMNR